MLDTEANQPSISLGITMVSVRAVVTLKRYQLCQVPDTVPNSKCELSSFLPACLVTQSCPTPCDPMDCSLPGSSVHGTVQARILEWVAMPSSRGSSWPRDGTWISCIVGWFLTVWTTRETLQGNTKELVLVVLFSWVGGREGKVSVGIVAVLWCPSPASWEYALGSLLTDFLPLLGSKLSCHCLPSCPDSRLFWAKA